LFLNLEEIKLVVVRKKGNKIHRKNNHEDFSIKVRMKGLGTLTKEWGFIHPISASEGKE